MENANNLEAQQFLMGVAAFTQRRAPDRLSTRQTTSRLPISLQGLNCPLERTSQEIAGFLADFNTHGPKFEIVDKEGLTPGQRKARWILRECNGDGVPLDISPDAFRKLFLRILK